MYIDYSRELTETETAIRSMSNSAMADRQAWLQERRSGLGGSDVAAIIGASPWKTYAALWAEKTGRWQEKDISASPSVRFGVDNEQKVAELFAEATGKKVYETGHFHRKDAFWMQASPDRLIFNEAAGLECKTASPSYAHEWSEGNIPDSYYCQVQWYMAVMGFDVWYIACLFRDTERFIWRTIERNDAFIKYMEQKASQFWGLVQTGTFPPNDGSIDYLKLVQEEYGLVPNTVTKLPKGDIELCKEAMLIDMELERLKSKKQFIMNDLGRHLGTAESGVAGSYLVKWVSPNSRNKYKIVSIGKVAYQDTLFD